MKEFIYKKLIYYFVILSPVIDMITSFMINNNLNITIGIITKMIILFLAVIYLVFIDKEKRKMNIIVLMILFAFSILNILNNLSIIDSYLFTYFNYLFKYVYHIIVLLFFIRLLKTYPIKICDIRLPLLITSGCYIIALITNTDFSSYAHSINKIGSAGWYSSANELGNLLCLFFPMAIYNAFENKDGIKFDIIICILIGICMLLLGTKVGILGYFIIILTYLVARLLFIKHYKLEKKYIIALMMLVIPLLLFNHLPAVHNIKYVYNDSNDLNYVINSGRDEFKELLIEQYNNSNKYSKIVGKTYTSNIKGEENILIAEQDFYDILNMYGYLGIIIILLLYLIIYLAIINKVFKYYKKHNSLSKKSVTILIAITLELLIAFISGHSLLSPSVSTYLTLFAAISFNLEFKNEKDNKKKVLISKTDELYKKINKNKYEVTVLNTKNEDIEKYETINISKKLKTKSTKINKLITYLLVRNQKYDYALLNDNNDDFDNSYLIYSNTTKKLNINDPLAIEIIKK